MSANYRRILCPACDLEIDVAPDGLVPDHARSSTGVPAHACPAAGFQALPLAAPFFPGVPARINAGGVCTGAYRRRAGEVVYCHLEGPHTEHEGVCLSRGTLGRWPDGHRSGRAGSSEPAVEA